MNIQSCLFVPFIEFAWFLAIIVFFCILSPKTKVMSLKLCFHSMQEVIEKYMSERMPRSSSSSSCGSSGHDIEDNYGDEDDNTKFEFEQFKEWLEAGSPSKIPSSATKTKVDRKSNSTDALPKDPVPTLCPKCSKQVCNLMVHR